MSLKRRRASSPATAPVSPKNVRLTTTTFNSRYEHILDVWSRLDEKPPLKDGTGQKCSRFLVDKEIITVLEMSLAEEVEGSQSEIYAIFIGDKEQPVILKKFIPDKLVTTTITTNDPEIEAELQKWAHRHNWTDCHGFVTHGFAPDVKAYNVKAMIIEKCSASLERSALRVNTTFRRMTGFEKKAKLFELNDLLGTGSFQIYSFVQDMFDACGLYNKDPNFSNYMYLRGELKQIDFGQNRFASEAKFNEFYKQLPVRLQQPELREQLLDIDSGFPPLYHWYTVMSIDTEGNEQRDYERGAWGPFVLSLKQTRQTILNRATAHKAALASKSTRLTKSIRLKF